VHRGAQYCAAFLFCGNSRLASALTISIGSWPHNQKTFSACPSFAHASIYQAKLRRPPLTACIVQEPATAKERPTAILKNVLLGEDLKGKYSIEQCPVIRSSACVARAFEDLALLDREVVIVGAVDSQWRLVYWNMLAVGTSDRVNIRIGEAFLGVIQSRGSGIFLVHNHPSGLLTPSNPDVRLTHDVAEAGLLLGYPLVDHVIISRKGFRSIMTPSILKRSDNIGVYHCSTKIASESGASILDWRCADCNAANFILRDLASGLCTLTRCFRCNTLCWIALKQGRNANVS
jgi:hypothetical protein